MQNICIARVASLVVVIIVCFRITLPCSVCWSRGVWAGDLEPQSCALFQTLLCLLSLLPLILTSLCWSDPECNLGGWCYRKPDVPGQIVLPPMVTAPSSPPFRVPAWSRVSLWRQFLLILPFASHLLPPLPPSPVELVEPGRLPCRGSDWENWGDRTSPRLLCWSTGGSGVRGILGWLTSPVIWRSLTECPLCSAWDRPFLACSSYVLSRSESW